MTYFLVDAIKAWGTKRCRRDMPGSMFKGLVHIGARRRPWT